VISISFDLAFPELALFNYFKITFKEDSITESHPSDCTKNYHGYEDYGQDSSEGNYCSGVCRSSNCVDCGVNGRN
jgi:hypothetical protein